MYVYIYLGASLKNILFLGIVFLMCTFLTCTISVCIVRYWLVLSSGKCRYNMVYHEICSHKWSIYTMVVQGVLIHLGRILFRKKQFGPSNMTVLSKGVNVLPSCSLTFYHDTTPSLRVVH